MRLLWLLPLLLTACDSSIAGLAPTAPTRPDVDGSWVIVTDDALGFMCIVVLDGTIVQVDGGCIGRSNAIISNQPAVITGNRALWTFASENDQGNVGNIAIDVAEQPDGSFVGTVTGRDAAGNVTTAGIVMNRR